MGKIDVKSSVTIEKEKIQRSLTSMNLIFKRCPANQEAAIIIKSEQSNKLQMIANSAGVFIRTISDAEEINNVNQWCLDGMMLSRFIKTMNKGKVTIQSDDSNIYAKQGRTTLKIPLKEVETDLNPYNYEDMTKITIDSSELLKAMKQTMHACALATIKPASMGVLLDIFEDGTFSVVGTDSKRMAIYSREMSRLTGKKLEYRAVIPKSSVEEIVKIFEKNLFYNMYVSLYPSLRTGDTQNVSTVGFISDDVEFYSQTIADEFHDYMQIMAHMDVPIKIIVEKETLLERLNQVNTCSDKCLLTFKRGGIEVKSLEGRHSSEITVYVDMPIDTTGDLKIAVINKYCIEGLASISSRRVEFRLATGDKPFTVAEYYDDQGEEDIKYAVIMMPYQLIDEKEETPVESGEDVSDASEDD